MKRLAVVLFVTAWLLPTASGAPAQGVAWQFDRAHTTLGFSVSYLSLIDIPGAFRTYTGSCTWSDETPATSRIDLDIRTDSIDTRNAKRNAHLASADFFWASEHPVIRFRTQRVSREDGLRYRVQGALTMRGITRTVSFPLTFTAERAGPTNLLRGFTCQFSVSRSEFLIGTNFPPPQLGDEVKIKFHAVLVRPPG